MAGTIVVDRLESDASYASRINVASPLVVSNTISLGSAAAVSGNLNITNSNVTINTAQTSSFTVLGSNATAFGVRLQQVQSGNTAIFGFDNSALLEIVAPFDFRVRNYGLNNPFYINSSGFVTTPYQPGFRAARTTSFTISSITEIAYNSEIFDRSGTYNPSTGRFTAPVSGLYFFTAHLQPTSTGINCNITFRVNGSLISNSGSFATPLNSRMDLVTSIVLNLNANDYVSVWAESGSSQLWDNHGQFSGFLIG